MVGGGNRRDEGSFTVSNTNVFAALETLKKKKKSDKDKASSKGSKSSSKTGKSKQADEEKPPVFWAPAPLTVKSWADVDDEDDDDYYATTAPPQAIWGGSSLNKGDETEKQDHLEESETEDELLDEGDDDVEDEPDHETQVQEHPEPIVATPVEHSPAPKETERQLSKKERKKKELAELDAILADFGVNPKEKAEDVTNDVSKDVPQNGVAEKKDSAPAESKSAKKKKKKDKASKEAKEHQDLPNTSDVVAPNEQSESAESEQHVEGDSSAVDMKERLKKMASAKKKKSGKEVDAAARAAAMEAAARSAKLVAAKKKEKNHYNQQPIR